MDEHIRQPASVKTLLGLGMVSASVLAYEISLSRVFAIQQFHHFAFLVVSLALLGIAAGGTVLAISSRRPSLATLAGAYSGAVAIAYLIINYLPFDSYSIAWDRSQVGVLLLYFLSAGFPFFLSGLTVGTCLEAAGVKAHRPYAANLSGSAFGCLLALAMHAKLGAEGTLAFSVALGLASVTFFTSSKRIRSLFATLAIAIALASLQLPDALALKLSPYKPLSNAVLAPDAERTMTAWSTSSRLDAVESQAFHIFPGLSLGADIPLPQQVALFIDGDGPFPISNLDPADPSAGKLTIHMPSSLAYSLRPGAQTLILSPGAGLETILALASGAANVTVSDPEPLISAALRHDYRRFSHELLSNPRVTLTDRSDRGTLREPGQAYDVIQFALSDPFRPVNSGAFSLNEEYSLTTESFRDAYRRLNDTGILVVTRWLATPPSESARAWATLLAALEASGLDRPGDHLVAYRGMRTATIIASRAPFTQEELALVRAFLADNALDPIFLPDLKPSELNRFNQLPEDTYHELYSTLLENFQETIKDYDFDLRPATDDRPFFFHFFRWRQTPNVVATLGMTWQPFGGSGYLIMLGLLGLVTALALPLALAPMVLSRPGTPRQGPGARMLVYFAMLGAGYILIEIPLIQRMTLLLDRPALSLATVLFVLLLASGAGSLISPRMRLRLSLTALMAAIGAMVILLPSLIEAALPWSLALRLAISAAILCVPGVLMGIPFVSGLRLLEDTKPGLIPWAWAINGAASGIAGVLAAMSDLDLGIRATMALGAIAYLVAWLCAPSQNSQHLRR